MWLSSLFLLLLCIPGCPDTVTIEHPIVVSMPAQENSVMGCFGEPGADTFVVDVLTYEGPIETIPGRSPGCRRCLGDDATCTLLRRECYCSSYRNTPEEVLGLFNGVRISDVETDLPICVRVTMIDRGMNDGPVTGPGQMCSDIPQCQTDWLQTDDESIRGCALSSYAELGTAEQPILVSQFACRQLENAILALQSSRDACDGVIACAVYNSICEILPSLCEPYTEESLTVYNCATIGL